MLDSRSRLRLPHCWGFYVTDTPRSIRLLRTSDQHVEETSTWQNTAFTRDRQPRLRRDSNPAIPASEQPQTYVLGRAAPGLCKTGISNKKRGVNLKKVLREFLSFLSKET